MVGKTGYLRLCTRMTHRNDSAVTHFPKCGSGGYNPGLSTRQKFQNCLLKINELDEFKRVPSDTIFVGPQFLELEKLQGFKVSVKNSVSVCLGPNVTDFHLPKCKFEHEVKDNLSTAKARAKHFSVDPILSPTSGLNFGKISVKLYQDPIRPSHKYRQYGIRTAHTRFLRSPTTTTPGALEGCSRFFLAEPCGLGNTHHVVLHVH